jgi:uncharacterized protein YbjT (DUF2867 family)
LSRPAPDAPIVLAGATGHVGGALLERLVEDGRTVRCIVRDPSKLTVEADTVEPVEADLGDRDSLRDAFVDGCVAYFLVHALASGGGSLAAEERTLAENFADAAREAGAARIVYLGGLVDEDEESLSPHMESRIEVGRALRESGVQTVELRASIVIGAGSFSFELIRRLVDQLPVLVLPDWVDNLAQPIALADVVAYLAAAADAELEGSAVVEIGGAEQISYRGLIEAYARAVEATPTTVPVPVPEFAADAAARLAEPVTDRLPGDAQEALKLLESLRHTTVVRDRSADAFAVRPMTVDEAIAAALAAER